MENILGFTGFIRHLKTQKLGYSLVFYITDGKTYAGTVNSLTATAAREGIKISTSQVLMCEEGKTIVTAIRVTKK